MADFKVNSEVLRTKATEVRDLKQQSEEMFNNRLRTIIDALGEVWSGQAYQKFVNDYETIRPTFTKLAETLEKVASDLEKDAGIYEDAERSASSN